ncbi:MAG TPA: hypothetical protein VFZ61_00550 [Polyangiales bacterium]
MRRLGWLALIAGLAAACNDGDEKRDPEGADAGVSAPGTDEDAGTGESVT